MRCFVCNSPKLVEDRSYYDIQGYHYGLCEHSEDIGTQMECPSESTACGKLAIRADKSKVVDIIEEVKHLLPYAYSRRSLDITKFKQMILRERGGRRPSEGKSIEKRLYTIGLNIIINNSTFEKQWWFKYF